MMYVRFDASYKVDDRIIYGIFPIMGYLFDNYFTTKGNRSVKDERRLSELNEWFKYNLELPSKVRRNKNLNKTPIAVSWFKSTAYEHIQNLRKISNIIQRYGVVVSYVRNEKPGYVLYEDEYQIFAEPYE
jgi:hypothetical protein